SRGRRASAHQAGIDEKEGNIAQIRNECIPGDRVEIVKMEGVLKVVGIGRQHHQDQRHSEKQGSAIDKVPPLFFASPGALREWEPIFTVVAVAVNWGRVRVL